MVTLSSVSSTRTVVSMFDAVPKTPQEIVALKRRWRERCRAWNIEQTGGFEAHYLELLAYRIECEVHSCVIKKNQAWDHEIKLLADRLGCSGNLRLAEYVLKNECALLRFEEPGLRLQSVR
ncbi:hypothetical protein QCD60_19855 [Pokkaliibacter sp. MBI-7]|uniref:hypothetical protein n=1 Tax=Pokkaliibacter sp. MBI-7 TaxID=3040600 RepID=UPI00244CFE5F|nr:hypothetical protein [Pokkaliibacter sp. MBI-7]MDH2434800.1 hypothetical protein [Pokkaliibacter sp. MBI-7]